VGRRFDPDRAHGCKTVEISILFLQSSNSISKLDHLVLSFLFSKGVNLPDSELESIRRDILQLTVKYAELLEPRNRFRPGIDPVPVSGKVLMSEDFRSLVDACLDGWLTSGRFTKEFEKNLAQYVGTRSALFVNSGSSANLLAVSGLTSLKLGEKRLKKGDEVITVAMGFPTTVNPIIQNGLVPVVVDIDLQTLVVDTAQIEEAVTDKTRAIMLAHTLGNPFDVDAITKICEKYNLWLIEDSCDALGSTYNGRNTGSFGDVSTFSFYPAHHITTGEGGAVLTNSPLVHRQIESFRDWGRDCYCETGKDNTCAKRFGWKLGELPLGYDHKYTYSHIGYNLKATDMQAAIGITQLAKIEVFVKKRKDNYEYLRKYLSQIKGLSIFQATRKSDPAWFGCAITLDEQHPVNREELLRFLESRKIGTRLVFAGNILKQPAYKDVNFKTVGNLVNTDIVMKRTFWIGVYPGITQEMLDYVIDSISTYMKNCSR
jgi:CDP-6-deoxy-D-xylo-4-hexulose-3-dehydrase